MLTILLVDDQQIVRDGVRLLLQKKDYGLHILEAENGQTAVQLLRKNRVDILFTDVEMPLMNGIQLSEEARKIAPDIKIIFFSAHDDFEYARGALNVRAVTYILKPIQPAEFYKAIDQVIRLCREEADEKARIESLESMDKLVSDREIEKYLTDMYFHGEFEEVSLHPPFHMLPKDADARLKMFFVRSNIPVLSRRMDEIAGLLREISPVPVNFYVISSCNGVITFELSPKNSILFSIDSWWRDFQSGIQAKIAGIVLLVIETKCVSDFAEIADEMKRVRRLLNLAFYIHGSTLIRTDSAEAESSSPINTDAILEDMRRSIESGEYDKLSEGLRALLNALSVNREYSLMYVKYLLLDLVNRIAKQDDGGAEGLIARTGEAVAESSDLKKAGEALFKCFQELEEMQSSNARQNNRYIRKILSIINSEYASDLSLDSLAARVNLSVPYMCSLFKKEIGESIGQYIKQRRMEKARELLSDTSMRLNDIYPLAGYSSLTYFCISFKETYGVTPTQFRNQLTETGGR